MPGGARSLVALVALVVAWKWPIPAVAGEPDSTKSCKTECITFVSKPIPLNRLDSYRSITCRAKTSIILKTKKEKYFCARREDNWVKEVMQQLDARNVPPTSRDDTTPENHPVVDRQSGEVTKGLADQSHIPKTFNTTPYKTVTLPVITTRDPNSSKKRVLAGSETPTYPLLFTPQPEAIAAKPTFQSDSVANREMVSETTEGHKRFWEHFSPTKKGLEDFAGTSRLLVSPPNPLTGTDGTSTNENGFLSETLMRSSTHYPVNSSISKLLTEFVTKVKTSITIPNKLSNSSDQRSSFLSSFNRDRKPQSVEGSTVRSFPTSFNSHSSTHPSSDGNSLRSVNFRDIIDAESEGDTSETPLSVEPSTLGSTSDTLPISGYHQETFKEKSSSVTITNTPSVPFNFVPLSQSKLQDYIIPMVSIGGVLCLMLAIGGLVYVKRSIRTRQSPKRQVQGLVYFPCDSEAESNPMETL